MSKIVWDKIGDRYYETGLNQGVLYVYDDGEYDEGVAWNGLISVNETPTGAEPTALYADNIKYLNLMSQEEFEATIEAYTYPDEYTVCDGSAILTKGVLIGQQNRKTFGLCYRTIIGNDTEMDEHGYKLHIIYGALASPSDKERSTINDTPEAITFSWSVSTTPVEVTGYRPTAKIEIDSTKVNSDKLAALEKILYGVDAVEAVVADPMAEPPVEGVAGVEAVAPRLPLPDEILTIMQVSNP